MKMPNKQYIIFNKKIPYNDITVIHISWCISHIIHFMYETLLPRRPPPHSASEMMGTSTISFLTLWLSIKDFS